MSNSIIETTYNLWCSRRKIKKTAGGWLSGNAVCCSHNGQSIDTRGRGGIIIDGENKLNYSCFNCGFKASYTTGIGLGVKFKKLLDWLGADSATINQLTIEALRMRDEVSLLTINSRLPAIQKQFEHRPLPSGARDILDSDVEYIQFLTRRGLHQDSYPFKIVDGESRQRIIIPYWYCGKLVGSTSRYLDDRKPKYIADRQSGYVFNLDEQRPEYAVCILVEGEFDAISIGGCAYMGNNISDEQAGLLNQLGRKIIVVPDRDQTGLNICDRALDLGWSVSIPSWSSDIKDVNDALKKYGKLPILLSILEGATTNRIKIKMQRNKLV